MTLIGWITEDGLPTTEEGLDNLPFIIQNHFRTFKWIQTVLVDLKDTKILAIFQYI